MISAFDTMDYTSIVTECSYKYEVMRLENDMREFMHECVVLSEGVDVINRVNAIHEAAADKKNSFWQKFKTFFTKIWFKFIERVDALLKKDSNYLQKYKNIILGKKMIDAKYTIPNYADAIKRIENKNNLIFPDISFMEKLEAQVKTDYQGDGQSAGNTKQNTDNKDKWRAEIQAFITNNEIKPAGDESFAEACKKYYSGGDAVATESSKLNISDMYNFCISKDTLIKNIKTQNDAFQKWMNTAEQQYNSSYKKLTSELSSGKAFDKTSNNATITKAKQDAEKVLRTNNTANGGNGTKAANESAVLGSFYSVVYESTMLVTEAGVERETTGKTTSDTGSSSTVVRSGNAASNGATGVKDMDSVNKGRDNVSKDMSNKTDAVKKGEGVQAQAKDTAASNYADAKAKNVDIENATKEWTGLVSQYVKIVTETSATVFGAICTAAEKIGRDYMSIIRQHVNDYLGGVNKSDDDAGAVKSNTTNADYSGTQNVTGGNTPGLG